MTMHLASPQLTTTANRTKRKQKFRNAAQAQQSRALQAEWERKQAEWAAMSPRFSDKTKKNNKIVTPVVTSVNYRDDTHAKSLGSWITGAVSSKQTPTYTGTKIIGIGTLHKSNAIPVFSDQEAIEISRMRRG